MLMCICSLCTLQRNRKVLFLWIKCASRCIELAPGLMSMTMNVFRSIAIQCTSLSPIHFYMQNSSLDILLHLCSTEERNSRSRDRKLWQNFERIIHSTVWMLDFFFLDNIHKILLWTGLTKNLGALHTASLYLLHTASLYLLTGSWWN